MASGSNEYPDLETRLDFLGLSPSATLSAQRPQSPSRLFMAEVPARYCGKDRAAVSGGTVASFTRLVSDEDEQAVLDCDTYLQQYTDERFDRQTQWYEWLQHYTKGFWYLGWIHQRPVMLESRLVTLSEPISDAVLKTLEPMADAAVYAAAMEAFEALKINLKASLLLAEQSGNERGRQFLTLPCSYDTDGRLTSSLIHSWYLAKVDSPRFLFFRWENHDITLAQHFGTFTLDRSRFSEIEHAMRNKMKDRSRRFFERL